MPLTRICLAVLVGLSVVVCLSPAEARDQPQSAKRPAPDWLELADQGSHDKRLAGYRAPKGLKVEIVAEHPAVTHPIALAFSDDGAPHVVEWAGKPGEEPWEVTETVRFRDGTSRKFPAWKKKTKDPVKVLSSSKPGGPWDTAKVLLEDEFPSGILLHDGWLYLTGRGSVRRYKPSKPGGPYDTREVVAQGFSALGQRQVSGLTVGPDGWLYVTSGDDDNFAEGADGSRATVLRSGAIFRCRPDGSRLHAFATGFHNPRGNVAFNLDGHLFHVDGGLQGAGKFSACRLLHAPEGADFGWRLAHGPDADKPDPVRAVADGELPGRMPPILTTGAGSPGGVLIYNDTQLPENYRGLLLAPDPERGLIRAYKVAAAGAGFLATHEFEFLAAPKDERFRPCQMTTGPDGAVYVVDWRGKDYGGWPLGDGGHGRIYRISWSGTAEQPAVPLRKMDSWASVGKLDDKQLVETLSSEDATVREKARHELVRRGDRNRKALVALLADRDAPTFARVNAIGALQWMDGDDVRTAFRDALAGSDVELQRRAAEALALLAKPGDRAVQDALLKAVATEDRSLRRAVAVAMGRAGGPGTAANLASSLSFDTGKDVLLRDGLVRGLEMLGKPGTDALLALADSGVQKDTDLVVQTFLAMRTRPAFDALPTLFRHAHVSSAQRAELVRSCVNYLLDPPVSLEGVVTLVTGHLKDLRDAKARLAIEKALLEALATPGPIKGEKAATFVLDRLNDRDPGIRLAATAAAGEMRLAKAAAALLKRLEKGGDAADRLAAVRALGGISTPESVRGLEGVLAASGDAPTRLEALRSLAVTAPEKAAGVARKLLHEKAPDLQREAVRAMGRTPAQAAEVGKLFAAGKLPKALRRDVVAVLRRHAGRDAEAARLLAEVRRAGGR